MDEVLNFCVSEGVISECSATKFDEQKKCGYYEKASSENRCMFRVMGEFCDSVRAQKKDPIEQSCYDEERVELDEMMGSFGGMPWTGGYLPKRYQV